MKNPKRHVTKWGPGWISSDCKSFAITRNFSISDIETYSVLYDDCASPWILCHHKHSPDPPAHFFENFGRIPVHARSYVRGAVIAPDPKTPGAYNGGDFIAVFTVQNAFKHQLGTFETLLHETGHSLDHHAYKPNGAQLSQTKEWTDAVTADAKVSDTYGASTLAENVAQMTVIAAYDVNVPGHFQKIEPKWRDIQNTLALMRKTQTDAGDLLIPSGMCTRRIENPKPLPIKRKVRRRSQLDVEADSDDELDLVESDTVLGGGPSRRSEMPDVSLAEGLEVIPPSKHGIEYRCEH